MYLEKAELVHPVEFKKPDGVLGRDWHVFDDHVGINENVIEKDDSFLLNARPVGEVCIFDRSSVAAKSDCPEYQKCLSEFGDKLAWCCSNCGFDPPTPKEIYEHEFEGLAFEIIKLLNNIPIGQARAILAEADLVLCDCHVVDVSNPRFHEKLNEFLRYSLSSD